MSVTAFLSSSTPKDESELRYSSFAFFLFVSLFDTEASDESLEELLELLSSSVIGFSSRFWDD